MQKIGIVFCLKINWKVKLFGASLSYPIKVWYFIKIVAFEAEYQLVRVASSGVFWRSKLSTSRTHTHTRQRRMSGHGEDQKRKVTRTKDRLAKLWWGAQAECQSCIIVKLLNPIESHWWKDSEFLCSTWLLSSFSWPNIRRGKKNACDFQFR